MSHTDQIEPHQAFAELANIALADHSLDSVMEQVAALTKRTLAGAAEVSVTLVERGKATTAAYTGPLALQLDERQYASGYGPCLNCIDGGVPLLIRDMATETRWPQFCAEAHAHGVGSSLSMPMPLQREVAAALNIYGTDSDAFDDDDVESASTLAGYAGVALANMHLHTAQGEVAKQLQTAMESRAVIDQAKGILMAQQRCTAADAFNLLIRASQRENRKLKDVAHEIVDRASQPRS